MAYEEENKYNHLEELNGSDYQIVEGEPDITGWAVIDAQGRVIGEVEDVLFDPETRNVRYMIVDLAENELSIDIDKKVLVPIGIAELPELYDDEEADADEEVEELDETTANNNVVEDDDVEEEDDELVYLPSVTIEHLLALPSYEKGNLSPEKEAAIRNVFEPRATDEVILYEKESFYSHDHFKNRIYPDRTDEIRDTDAEGENRDRNIL